MYTLCPTITAFDLHEYRAQIEAIEGFASRVHIDLMDGKFTETVSPGLKDIWLPKGITCDIHLMYKDVETTFNRLVELSPDTVIVHAEIGSSNDLPLFATKLREAGIKTGLALLPDTTVESVRYLLPHFQQALVFSGNLGHHGGVADLNLVEKVKAIKQEHRWLEIAWDGGINDENIVQLRKAGVTVFNVGGYIQKSDDPKGRYESLLSLLQS